MAALAVHQQVTGPAPAGPDIPPLWKETLWPLDWLSLRLSPVYYGIGVPRGDGSAVVLVPGFMMTDATLSEMYFWLGRIGYRPYMSRIGLNAECPGVLTKRLTRTVQRARRETGRPVRIIGHSLGGIIGRRVCLERPELASQLIFMGSPVQAFHAHPAVVAAAVAFYATASVVSPRHAACLTGGCRCGMLNDAERPFPDSIRHDAIFTRADGVVDWHDAQEQEPRRNHEVGGTHVGLVCNPRAYRVLGSLLAAA